MKIKVLLISIVLIASLNALGSSLSALGQTSVSQVGSNPDDYLEGFCQGSMDGFAEGWRETAKCTQKWQQADRQRMPRTPPNYKAMEDVFDRSYENNAMTLKAKLEREGCTKEVSQTILAGYAASFTPGTYDGISEASKSFMEMQSGMNLSDDDYLVRANLCLRNAAFKKSVIVSLSADQALKHIQAHELVKKGAITSH